MARQINFIDGPADGQTRDVQAAHGDVVAYWSEGVTLGYAYRIVGNRAVYVPNADVHSLPPMVISDVASRMISEKPGPDNERRQDKWAR